MMNNKATKEREIRNTHIVVVFELNLEKYFVLFDNIIRMTVDTSSSVHVALAAA